MLRSIFIAFLGVCLSVQAMAQLSPEGRAKMEEIEDIMITMGDSMINNMDDRVRIRNAYLLIPMLKDALVTPGSWNYKFDSIHTISIMYPPDSSFRIFSWHFLRNSGRYRHLGAIQMRSDSLVLKPLIDGSEFMTNTDTITDNNYWFGALYYNILERKIKGDPYYFLFGYDANNKFSIKKVIDVLHFDKNGTPWLGAPVFTFVDSATSNVEVKNRFFIEYSNEAAASLNFIPEYGKIIYDHLVPLNPRSVGVYSTYIPDGTYEGFDWKKDHWDHIDKVFHFAINLPDSPPMPAPIDFEKRRKEEQKMIEKAKKERAKEREEN